MLVILALLIGARLSGFIGIMLSVPIAAALFEFVGDVERRKMAEEKALEHNA
jgi:predicted PurR-regulated permease PerM